MLGVGTVTAAPLDHAAEAYDKGDYAQTIKILKPLAAEGVKGNANAQYFLGSLYENGQGTPQNYREAVKWYRLAAKQGDVNGQLALGVMYRKGKGVTQDSEEALKWCRLAAEQRDPEAQFRLGVRIYTGLGVPQDYSQEASRWCRLAAEQDVRR